MLRFLLFPMIVASPQRSSTEALKATRGNLRKSLRCQVGIARVATRYYPLSPYTSYRNKDWKNRDLRCRLYSVREY